jgi:clan AA aspartic protease (TIGR02281 family)
MSGNAWAGYYRRGVPPPAPLAVKPRRAKYLALVGGGLVAASCVYAIVTGAGGERDHAVVPAHHFAGHVDDAGQCYFDAVADGSRFSMLADSGASAPAFGREHLARLGVNATSLRFNHKVSGATGSTKSADITLHELRIGDYVAHDVAALIIDTHATGSDDAPLLGMSALKGMRFELGGGECSLSWQ